MLRRKAEAIALLQRLQELGRAAPGSGEGADAAAHQWSGIGFRVGTRRLVAPLGQIAEVLPYPMLTRVPGARAWMKGVANVRGNLFTVADLSEFCGEAPVDNDLRARLIAINLPEVNCGVLVNEVLGMRQFDVESVVEPGTEAGRASARVNDPVAMAMRRVFRHEGVAWQEFDFRALVASAGFQDVSA